MAPRAHLRNDYNTPEKERLTTYNMPDGKSLKRVAHEAPQIEEPKKEQVKEPKERKGLGIKEKIAQEVKKFQEPSSRITIPSKQTQTTQKVKSPLQEDIEGVLAEGLAGYYKSLTPVQRKQFKEEGEKTASKIEALVQKARVKVIEIISLIRKWLSMLPGVNRFFVEQESKIKADKIMLIKEEQEEQD